MKLGLLPGAGGTQRLPRAGRPRSRAEHDRLGRRRCRRRSCKDTALFDEVVEGDLLDGARRVRRARSWPRSGRCRACATCTVEHPRCRRRSSQFAQNSVAGGRADYPAPLQVRRCGRGRRRRSRSTRARGSSASSSSSSCRRPSRRRCATRSSPSAPRARSPTCPDDDAARARSRSVGGHRRRHHGRRHRDELRQRRHPGDAARDEAGGARQGHRDHPQELRERGRRRASSPRGGRRSAWRCSRPRSTTTTSRDADIVIEAVFEDMDVKEDVFREARRGDEAGRDPRHQHLDARRRPDRRVHASARRTWSACTSSARRT